MRWNVWFILPQDKRNSLRITYSYGDSVWSDLLTDFNGTPITYDEIGNPLTMGSRELSWRGRQLTHLSDGDNEISYAYNGDGQRVSKTVNGTTTEYFYNGELLAGQRTGDSILVFMYDNNGDIFGFLSDGTEYYYVKNAQNDVTAIASADGTIIANYYYDSWGQITEVTGNTEIAEINPIRYRSYYYDSETEWYFLNTRYYSPELCRFINADGYIQTGQGMLDKNMFTYCLNNPIDKYDPLGNFALTATICGIAIWKIAAVVVGMIVVSSLAYTMVKKPPVAPSFSLPRSNTSSKSTSRSKSETYVERKTKNRDHEPRKHHIVAQAAWRAAPARKILQDVGINPTYAPENLIVISQGLHKNMHTRNYYDYVNDILVPLAGDREAIEQALLGIREDIMYAELTGIRRWEIS